MNKENGDVEIIDRLTFFNAIRDAKKLNENFDWQSTFEVYKIFGLIYGQTEGSGIKNIKVKISNKEKWLWAKIKYGF